MQYWKSRSLEKVKIQFLRMHLHKIKYKHSRCLPMFCYIWKVFYVSDNYCRFCSKRGFKCSTIKQLIKTGPGELTVVDDSHQGLRREIEDLYK